MSFLSAAFLIALPLIAVPVAIHLYRGRQRNVIMWGAMQFLASAVTKGRRMERIEELILMALRLAAVTALVLALARPMIRSNWLGQSTEQEVILVLDNSLSMSREIDGQSANDRLKELALEAIGSLSGGDSVQVLLAVGNEWATSEGIAADNSGKNRLRDLVADVAPTFGTANLVECLQAAVHVQSSDELAARRVIVFTDGQAKSWKTDSQGAWQQLADERDAAAFPISLEVIDCGLAPTEIDNLAVSSVRAVRSLVRPGEQAELIAEIANMGNLTSATTRVEWLVDGEVVSSTPVGALQAGGKAQVTASVGMNRAGVFAVCCRIAGSDQVPLDQEGIHIVEVADELPVLFVAADADTESLPASELFAAALGYQGDLPQSWHSVYRPESIAPSDLAGQPLSQYRAIVINNLSELDAVAMERLDSFVRAGGGLWVALGDQIDKTWFNRDWYSDGDGLSLLELDSLTVIDRDNIAATVHPPSRDHPATLQLANTTQLDMDEARVRERWIFAERGAEIEAVSALLESGTGQPLAVEKYVGQGRVVIQAFPLGLEWSNLPLLKSYVVMVHDWLAYVTAPTTARFNLEPGAPIVSIAPETSHDVKVELVTPRGQAISLLATDADDAPVYRYTQTMPPGIYRVRFSVDGGAVGEVPYVVTRDADESDVTTISLQDRQKLVAAGLSFAGAVNESVSAANEREPRREPFWGLLLVALVTLLAGELLLSGGLARQRHGLAVSAH